MASPRPAVSDHFDGQRYFNSEPTGTRGLWPVLRWQWQRRRSKARWPDWIDDPPQAAPPAELPLRTAALTFIGHSSFLIRLRGDGATRTLLTDPVFSERCSPFRHLGPRRVRAPGIAIDALPAIEAVLVSHNHYDHMDLPSLRALHRRFQPRCFTLAGNAVLLARGGVPGATELDWWDRAEWDGVRVTATPARHFSARTPRDRDRALWGGFMLEYAGGRLLFAGDSGAGDHWATIRQRLGKPDIALLPIGAYEPRWLMAPVHMNPADAAVAYREMGARHAIGMHFGTFQLTDEAIDQPQHDLEEVRKQEQLAIGDFDVLQVGETRVLPFG